MFQSILGSDSLLWVVSEESVEQIESVLCDKRRRELLPQMIVGLVSKGHLHKKQQKTVIISTLIILVVYLFDSRKFIITIPYLFIGSS